MQNYQLKAKDEVDIMNHRLVMEEAARCLLCEDAPCNKGCPALTNPAKFIRSIRFRNDKGAAETIRENNPLGGICAYICPTERLCEKACVRGNIDYPVRIAEIQKYAIYQEKMYGMKTMKAPQKQLEGQVACIGSGPSSLAVASSLAQKGYKITVFEKNQKVGGVLRYGIVPSRLPEHIVDYEVGLIEELGVQFICNHEIGKDTTFDQLAKQFDAIYIGVGLSDSHDLAIEGRGLSGIVTASSYLHQAREPHFYPGKKVIVIGGGDVAMDCAITAKNHGAEVSIYYRRSLEEAPASRKEIKEVITEENIPMVTNFAPQAFLGTDGILEKVHFKGRYDDSEMIVRADTVVLAIGQKTDEFVGNLPFSKNQWSCFEVDIDGMTSKSGVFSGGDVVNGGKTVVEAVAMGKQAAESIESYISSQKRGEEYGCL